MFQLVLLQTEERQRFSNIIARRFAKKYIRVINFETFARLIVQGKFVYFPRNRHHLPNQVGKNIHPSGKYTVVIRSLMFGGMPGRAL